LYEDTINKQIESTAIAIATLESNISKLYDLNIIPPDYRTMECIITLDHIFRNDLASTVREAILLYKEWVFQGHVLTQMEYMQRTLESIDVSMNAICSDFQTLIELQQQQGRTQEKLLEETRCTRYATEAVQKSNEKYEWYTEQHRQGLL